jgi:hypothetical protein
VPWNGLLRAFMARSDPEIAVGKPLGSSRSPGRHDQPTTMGLLSERTELPRVISPAEHRMAAQDTRYVRRFTQFEDLCRQACPCRAMSATFTENRLAASRIPQYL